MKLADQKATSYSRLSELNMDKIAAFPTRAVAGRSAKRIKQIIEAQNAGSRASLSKAGKGIKAKIVAQNKASKAALSKTAGDQCENLGRRILANKINPAINKRHSIAKTIGSNTVGLANPDNK